MSVALAGNAPATFEIKSANLPLVALLLKSTDLAALQVDLARRFGDMPDFFDHEPLVIDLTHLPADAAVVDFPALLDLLRPYRVVPIAFRGGGDAQVVAALAAGLVAATDAVPVRQPAAETVIREVVREVPAAAPQAASSALVVDRPLRSGQQVYARGRDLVVLAMVNPGAEVIADGHIHVYAPLRGKAIAGARGNAQARIFAQCMEPELVSIAGIYRTSETPLPTEVWGKVAQVRLVSAEGGDRLVTEPVQN
jgi:septum site-determining protein MinC